MEETPTAGEYYERTKSNSRKPPVQVSNSKMHEDFLADLRLPNVV